MLVLFLRKGDLERVRMELDQEGEQPLEKGACSADEEGGSCYGNEKKFSEVLGEDQGGLLCFWCWLISDGRGLRLNKGIGSNVSGFVLRGSWSLEETAGRKPV